MSLHYLGKNPFSKNKADYEEAANMLKKIRPYVAKFNSVSYIDEMARGTYCIALGWSGDINIARQSAIDAKSGIRIEALIPKGGAPLIIDTMAIPKDAPHPNNALVFMNYIMRPQVQAEITNYTMFTSPNLAARKYIDPDVLANKIAFPPNDYLTNKAQFYQVRSNATRKVMTRAFTQLKSGL